jgi:restriction endonuclease S subunit
MTSKRLSEISEIISGYSFRSALVNDPDGDYKVIQAKDITKDLEVSGKHLTKINLKKIASNAKVKINDAILTARGRYQAAVVSSSEPIIASSSVFIIRVTSPNLNPRFLAIFLNSRHGQEQLLKLTSGNYIKSIPKFNLENLIVQLPPLSEQNKIVKLDQNIEHQQKLLARKINIISNISEETLIKILK